MLSRAAFLIPSGVGGVIRAMRTPATGTGSEEGGDNTALAPSAEESALAQLLQAARNVANSGVDNYLQRLKQDRVDVGKQLATTTENITKLESKVKRLTSQLAAQEKARATAVLEIQRLTRQARTMSDMRGTSTASTLSGLNEFIASSRDFVRKARSHFGLAGSG